MADEIHGIFHGFNPKVKLDRPKTLMQGGDSCQFRWTLEG